MLKKKIDLINVTIATVDLHRKHIWLPIYPSVHNIKQPTLKVSSISYIIEPTKRVPRSTKTKARREYYLNHSVINTTDINNKKHEYLPDVYLKKHDIHYDAKKGFITLSKCPLHANTCNCRCITLPKYIVCN